MSIHTLAQKIKTRAGEHRQTLVFMGILAGTAIVSFYLGYIAHLESHFEPPISLQGAQNPYSKAYVVQAGQSPAKGEIAAIPLSSGAFVASKNGRKYYPVGCGSSKRIKDANKVFFNTKTDAEAQGYSIASGC